VGDLAVAAALTRALALDPATATGAHSLAHTIARARRLLISADLGMRWLPPASARAVRAHRTLLAATLDRVQEAGLDNGPVSTTPPWGAWVVARWGGWARPGGRRSDPGPAD
jgi:phytoene/squalene synthetase